MSNTIGENIHKLRRQRNLTQQQLSEIIGVSIAAISKWETGSAYPDIELLPKLASIFDVSIDYIFDFHLNSIGNRTEVIENADQLSQNGEHLKAISILTESLLRYPNDMLIKFNRAKVMINYATNFQIEPEKSKTLLEVNIELKEVISNSECREIIDESYYILCMSYINLKELDKAIEAINQIHQSNHINTGIALLRIYLEQGNLDSAIKQFELNVYLSLANIHANTVWTDQLFKDEPEKAILFYEMASGAFKAYCGNNSCRFDVYISTFYERAACAYAKAKKYEMAINSLKLAVEYAQSYDNLQQENDLPQFSRLNSSDTAWGKAFNQKSRLLKKIESIANEDYKPLLSMSEFKDIITALKR